MFVVYVIRSTLNRQLYVGFTEDFKQRLETHNAGKVISTKAYRPWKPIFLECYSSKGDALRRELYLKTTSGKRALKLMLRETLD
ncbi:GIY-YIG nuclease family protein [Candidatus Peribacteria bacterium]|nr:GIY-YIG nuclease family protein [Candidatus Peribacteria bacterium]